MQIFNDQGLDFALWLESIEPAREFLATDHFLDLLERKTRRRLTSLKSLIDPSSSGCISKKDLLELFNQKSSEATNLHFLTQTLALMDTDPKKLFANASKNHGQTSVHKILEQAHRLILKLNAKVMDEILSVFGEPAELVSQETFLTRVEPEKPHSAS